MDSLRVRLREGMARDLSETERCRPNRIIREVTGLDRQAAGVLLETGGVLVDGLTPSAARRLAQSFINAEIAVEVEPSASPPELERCTGVREPTLEARLRADPSDVDAHLVYSDWLQARGDPLGELIALQVELARAEGLNGLALEARDREFRRGHARALFGPLHRFADALVQRWSLGFIDAATIGLAEHDDITAPIRLLPELLQLPVAARMTALSLSYLLLRRRDIDRVLCRSEVVASLRTLELHGDLPYSEREKVPKLAKLWAHLGDSMFNLFSYMSQRLRAGTLAVVAAAPLDDELVRDLPHVLKEMLHARKLDLSRCRADRGIMALLERLRADGSLPADMQMPRPA